MHMSKLLGYLLVWPLLVSGPGGLARATVAESLLRGEVTLHIGEAFVFGDRGPIPDRDRSSVDLYCQDIRHGVSLACPQGAIDALAPLTSIGLPTEPEEAFALLIDAPSVLPRRDLWLLEKCSAEKVGMGMVLAQDGRVYKLCLLELQPHPEALRRSVRIRFEVVPQRDGGGRLALPQSVGQPPAHLSAAIHRALTLGETIPGQSFHRMLSGDYKQVDKLLPLTTLGRGEYVVLADQLQSEIRMNSMGAVFAGAGVGPQGKISVLRRGGVGVVGAMDGYILLDSYSYAYLEGPLGGTLEIDSYATVYLAGDLLGTLKVRSYTDLYLKGRLLGTLDAMGSCWCTFYFDGYHSKQDLASLPGDRGQITLHVRSSDLPAGTHKKVGSWREVIVADKVWKRFDP